MSTRTLAAFSTIRTEGAMLPSDILARVASGDKSLGGLEESSYHLAPGEKIGEATNRAWNRLQAAWANFQSAREKLAGTDTGTSLTRERWLLPLFQLLDYGRLQAAKAEEIGGKSYAISHAWQQTPIHLVGCNVDLDRRIQTAAGGMRSSPHSLVQELLNRSDQHLWGIVSNGLQLRLLRDNISLTRQAYVEFDLEAMMVGEAYPDFVLLWLLLHQSRFEAERPEQCQLEKWSQAARTEGVRVLDGLRDGVQRAIEHLGQGFLAHPSNAVLKENLRSGALDKQDYYRQILRLVYRLLFLFVADDRNLLLVPTADPVTQKRYREFYATTRLRHLATTRAGSRHHDLYCGLKLVMDKLSGDGCPELALPALGSFLFSPRALPALNGCDISNLHLLEAIRSLAVTQTGQSRRVVDYKNLGAEELGSVYESLLELHPDLNAEVASFELKVAAGSERKKTGSYYTPTSLISCLLDSALDPVLLEAAKQPEPEAAILKLRVVDPACGSGHFLIAAAHRIAKRLAAVRTGEEEPPPEAQRKAIRDVIGHCIYGVDVNPMAVELCKVSLWMEALEPGKPLSFLEHRVQSGNSLLGAAPALLAQGIPDEAFTPIEGDDKEICREFKRINKDERNKQMRLFTATTEPWLQLGNFAASLMNLDTVGDDSIEGIRKKERMYEEAIRSGDYLDGRFWADAWCAAFVWKKTREFSYPVTEEVFRRIERNPHACEPWMRSEIERLSGQYRFFHWHLAFPDIFHLPGAGEGARNVHTGWNGGFDVVLGNPPWERIKLQEKEWFSTKSEEVMNAPNAAARKRAIAKIKTEDPALYGEFRAAAREAEAESHLVRNGGRFKLCAQGDLNTYSLFAELFTQVLGTSGFGGIIVPTGIATDDSNSDFFGHLIEQKQLVSLFDFENRERVLFPEVYYRMRFCLLTVCGTTRSCQKPKFTFFALKVEDLSRAGQVFSLSKDDINLINPNSKTCPIFRSQRDAEITKAIYCKVPILLREALGTEGNPWGMVFARSFHMTNDAELFVSEDFFDPTWNQEGNVFTRANEEYLPLYEGRMIDNYDHRLASTRLKDIKLQRSGESITLTSADKTDPTRVARPRYWVSAANIESTSRRMFQQGWLLGCMSITSATNARTCVMSVVPQAGLGNSVIGLLPTTDARHQCCLLADACSLPFDYVCKQKVSGNNFNMFIIKQLPVPLPATFDEVAPWDRSAPLLEWIVPRVMEMAYTSNDLRKFARDAGFDGEPFRWDDDRRFLLRCELDASFLHLFGIDRESASHMIDAFTIVQSREEEEHGEYRTKRVILETYDAMAEAERTSVPYQTRLAPPPADPRVAHPPQSENVH